VAVILVIASLVRGGRTQVAQHGKAKARQDRAFAL